nr:MULTISPECIES: toll/interleukin-1 receptor domain-containing protein [Paenibacillus]
MSHSSKDKFFVRKLAEKLNEYGVKVWIDEAEIKVGDSSIEKISAGVKDSNT